MNSNDWLVKLKSTNKSIMYSSLTQVMNYNTAEQQVKHNIKQSCKFIPKN